MNLLNPTVIVLALLILTPLLLLAQTNNEQSFYILVGTYTSGKSEGIYLYRFDNQTGELIQEYIAKDIENPSFVTVSPDAKNIYAVNELHKEGAVSAYAFDASNATLKKINQQPSKGGDPCYVTVSKKGGHVFVGNYSGGNLTVFTREENGALGIPVQTIDHEGSSVNEERQEKPHVHSTVFTPDGNYLFVGDLGTDKIYAYAYNPEIRSNPLKKAEVPFTEVTPGSGPRHITFDGAGDFAYAVFELTADVAVFKHKKGKLTHLQTISMEPEEFKGEVSGAEIRISPDGKFLYASNRGEANEIVIYSIDQKNGTLTLVDRHSSMGKTPRNFIIDPTGNYLLVANQNSDNIVIFKRDKQSGKITPTGKNIEVGNPVYLTMTNID
ncbi:MAG: lactonase family protein [Candidatus Cyclobacteriaceae bacterium M2_1C_046]